MTRQTFFALSLASLLLLLGFGCRTINNSSAGATAQTYPFEGKVVSVDKAKKRVTLDHKEIPGFMDAMTMPFALKDPQMYDILQPGDKVVGTLVIENGITLLEITSVVQNPNGNSNSTVAPPTNSNALTEGSALPDLRVTNQDGKKTSFKELRGGRALLFTFIYTRCPLPDYCILMSENFGALSRQIAADPRLKNKAKLLSLTIDPAHDTPEVLKQYGTNYMQRFTAVDFNLWTFATAAPDDIKNFAARFGLSFFNENNQIIHSLRTVLVKPDGTIAKIYTGNEWKPEEVLAELKKITAG